MTEEGDVAPRTLPCPACGRMNHDTAHFCQQCAADLTSAAGAPDAPPPWGQRDDAGAEAPPWYRRTPILVAVLAGAILLVAGAAWLLAAGGDGETTDTTGLSTTTVVTPATSAPPDGPETSVTTPVPPPTAPPVALAAPVLTGVTPTCDPAVDPDAPCTIAVTWEHPGGADGFTVVATVQNGPVAGNSWVEEVGPDTRSAEIGPLATGLEECVQVIARRAGDADAASAEQCVSTGIG